MTPCDGNDDPIECQRCGRAIDPQQGDIHEYVTLGAWLCEMCAQRALDDAGCERCGGHSDVREVPRLGDGDAVLLQWHTGRMLDVWGQGRHSERRLCEDCQMVEEVEIEDARDGVTPTGTVGGGRKAG